MPRNTDTTQEAKTFVPKDEYRAIVAAADAEGVKVSEYIRRALRVRLESQGVNLPLDVKHGGDRKEVLPVAHPSLQDNGSGLLCIETAKTL